MTWVGAVISLLTALAGAIVAIWGWKQSADKKKAVKDVEKHKDKIRKAVVSGNIDAVGEELAKWI